MWALKNILVIHSPGSIKRNVAETKSYMIPANREIKMAVQYKLQNFMLNYRLQNGLSQILVLDYSQSINPSTEHSRDAHAMPTVSVNI